MSTRAFVRSLVFRALTVALALACVLTSCATDPRGSNMVTTARGKAPGSAEQLRSILIGRARVQVAVADAKSAALIEALRAWVEISARTVASFYGEFPVSGAAVDVRVVDGRGVHSGRAYGYPLPRVEVSVGRQSSALDLARDWVLVHELTHLAFPRVPDQHDWLVEGLATYLEPIARAQAGRLPERTVWKEMIEGMPHGLPAPGDQGLDFTSSWGRTYWGGALFCLMADVEIRQRTGNRFGLQHAVRAIVSSNGGMGAQRALSSVLSSADRAVGVTVLSELYEQWRAAAVEVDLPALWTRLGVTLNAEEVTFDEHAPLAGIRRAITLPLATDAAG